MSDLTQHRDALRELAGSDHLDDCHTVISTAAGWIEKAVHPDPAFAGCRPGSDRELAAHMADEIDAYLTAPAETGPDLFGEPA